MKPITEEQRQELIERGNDLLGMLGPVAIAREFLEIALASLTAEPVAEIRCMEDQNLVVENVVDGFTLGRHGVYTAPPVPVIKFPNVNLRISGLLIMEEWPTREWCFMEGARWMVGKINELNKLEG